MNQSPTKIEANVGIDGKPTNARHRMNMFEEELILSDKEKMRQRLAADKEGMKTVIKTMTPMDMFILFDEDDSGLIDFQEFRKMLPYLDVNINDAKAMRYFKMCDTDGSGEIDIDEFKVALFICDPTSGNSCGFTPSRLLTPLDAFETFDENKVGFIDEDEFFYALEYLNIFISDEKHEQLFQMFDRDHSGSIDFKEFREAFLLVCNLRHELEDRGVDVPALTRKSTLRNILRSMLLEEEERERAAIAEALRYKEWVMSVRAKKKVLQRAQFRAYQELRTSLDLGGHVYVFGGGTFKQFDQDVATKVKSKNFNFEYFDKVVELWKDRIRPQQLVDRLRLDRKVEEQEEKRDAERNLGGIAAVGKMLGEVKIIIDPFKEALCSPFHGINTLMNTAALWGRRVHSVAVSESVMFALADTGEIYTWGGNEHWWHEIQPDSIFQSQWRGDVTPRSQVLLGTVGKALPMDNTIDRPNVVVEKLTPEERKAEIIKIVCKYYNLWEPPPNSATRMIFLEKELLPKVSYEDVMFSLKCRGKNLSNMTKYQLCEELYIDINLERKLLGERAHKSIKELELQVAALMKRKKKGLADKVLKRIIDMWTPLREVQAEERAAELEKQQAEDHLNELTRETSYQDWRARIMKKREDLTPQFSPRGNSLTIDLSGVTPRGPDISTPRGFQAAIQVSAGAAHACLVHKTGQLYSWGVGAAGRLGLDVTEKGDPQIDVFQPRLVQALFGRPVLRVDCGYAHTGAIVAGGELYMWGSTSTGKCGLGPIVEKQECYCSIPTKVLIGPEDRRIRKLSCGSAHTAVITELGQLYVFGCGDGGRLGLGPGRFDTVYEPTLVECLLRENLASVSCGNTTTLVSTEVKHEWTGDDIDKLRVLGGGRLYVAGSRIVLGKQYDQFTLIEDLKGICVKQVSAGFQHSAAVTSDGELYCWGKNKRGCCGLSPTIDFIEQPTVVECLFRLPHNLALGKTAYQCSTFNNREACFAVDGVVDGRGVSQCSCTQTDNQAWLEIDLGMIAIVDHVKLWNRCDLPTDSFLPRDYFTSRLFPCWVMVGQEPFETETNALSLKNNLRKAMSKIRFLDDQRVSQWRLPSNSQVRYIRVQLEGMNALCVAQLEVFGHWGISRSVGRVSQAAAGRDVTVAVIRPSQDPRDTEMAYKRAAYSDSMNADILRQFETYALEYDKFGRGEVLQVKDCVMCKGKEKCEICRMFEIYQSEIDQIPPAVGGRRRRLRSIDEFLININKPVLKPIIVKEKERPSKWEMRRRWLASMLPFGLGGKLIKPVNEISLEEAMQADPEDMLVTLEEKAHAGAHSILEDNENIENEESMLKTKFSRKKGRRKAKTVGEDEASVVSSDTVLKVGPDGGVGTRRRIIAVGDVLETGHVVKSAVPRSILKQMERPSDQAIMEQALKGNVK